MKISFLLPVPSQARYHKRVSALKALGVEPTILAFERDYYAGRPWPDGHISLGQVQHGEYHKRLLPLLEAFPQVRAAARDSDVVYAFGLDMLLLGWLAGRTLWEPPKIVYEVGDIRAALLKDTLVSGVIRGLERFLLRQANLLVTTSEAFVTGYYQKVQGLEGLRYQVIENKLDTRVLSLPQSSSPMEASGSLHIGYFGLIRCRRSWEILRRAAEEGGDRIKVYVRGIVVGRDLENLIDESQTLRDLDYCGPYVTPDDLPDMYDRVDVVWASYPYHGGVDVGNWRWARTVRFYESCFFKKPMLVQAGTQDCQAVREFGIGICLDLSDVDRAVDRILEIGSAEICQWRQNLYELPPEVYTYTVEHKQLLEAIE